MLTGHSRVHLKKERIIEDYIFQGSCINRMRMCGHTHSAKGERARWFQHGMAQTLSKSLTAEIELSSVKSDATRAVCMELITTHNVHENIEHQPTSMTV